MEKIYVKLTESGKVHIADKEAPSYGGKRTIVHVPCRPYGWHGGKNDYDLKDVDITREPPKAETCKTCLNMNLWREK